MLAFLQRQIAGERPLGARGVKILQRVLVKELGFCREILIKAADTGDLSGAGRGVQAELLAAGAGEFGFVAGEKRQIVINLCKRNAGDKVQIHIEDRNFGKLRGTGNKPALDLQDIVSIVAGDRFPLPKQA